MCSILGVSPSTRLIAWHISADIFFRRRKEIRDDLAEPHPFSLYYIAHPIYAILPPFRFLFPCQFLLVFNFFCREKTACRSRLSIQMGSVYRDRTDHPLFPRRTTPFPMNNAFFRQESICRISRNVPTYSPSFFFLFLFLSYATTTQNIRIWVSENLVSPSLSTSHLFIAILRRRAQIRRLKGRNKRRI